MAIAASPAVVAPQSATAGVPRCDVFVLAADSEVLGLLSGQAQRPVLRLERVRLSRKVASVAAYLAKRWAAEARHGPQGRLLKLDVCAATRAGALTSPLFQLELAPGTVPRLSSPTRTLRDLLCCSAPAGSQCAVLVARLAGSLRAAAPAAALPPSGEALAAVLSGLPASSATWTGCLAAVGQCSAGPAGSNGAVVVRSTAQPSAGRPHSSVEAPGQFRARLGTAARADGRSGSPPRRSVPESALRPDCDASARAGLGAAGIGAAAAASAVGAAGGPVRGSGTSTGFGLTSLPLTQMGGAADSPHSAGAPSPLLPRHTRLPGTAPAAAPSSAGASPPRASPEPPALATVTPGHSASANDAHPFPHAAPRDVRGASGGAAASASEGSPTSSVAAISAFLSSREGRALAAAAPWRNSGLSPAARFRLRPPAPDACPRLLPACSDAARSNPGGAEPRAPPPPATLLPRGSSSRSARRRLTPVLVQGAAQPRGEPGGGMQTRREAAPLRAAARAGEDEGGLWAGEARECSGHPWEEALEVDEATGRVVAGGRRGPSVVRRHSRLVPALAGGDGGTWPASDIGAHERPWPGSASAWGASAATAQLEGAGDGGRGAGSERAVMERRMNAAEASPARRPRPPFAAPRRAAAGADALASREALPAETGSSSAASDDSGLGWAASGRPRSRRARRRIRPTVVSPEVAARESTDTPFSQASIGSVLAAGASRGSL